MNKDRQTAACSLAHRVSSVPACCIVLAVVKEHEMEIGYPTDVKHVAHIGWDSAAGNASPSWVNTPVSFSPIVAATYPNVC